MPPDSPSVAVLDEQDCLSLLRHGEVGRLATAVAGQPDIFPINYVLDGHSVVFCTAEGTKLAATFANTLVAFECDGYDSEAGDAWSVVIKGHAREISMHDLLESTFALYPWSDWPKPRFLRLVPDQISGRRFRLVRRRPV